MAYAKTFAEPAHNYFHSKFDNDLKPALDAFYVSILLLSPSKFHELKPTAGDIDCLRAFPFLNSSTIYGLKSEVAAYLAAAEVVPTPIDPIAWWNFLIGQKHAEWYYAHNHFQLQQSVFFHIAKLLYNAATVVSRGLCRTLCYATIQQSFD